MFSASSVAEGTGSGTEMEAMDKGAEASAGAATYSATWESCWCVGGEVEEGKVEGRDVMDALLQAAAAAVHGTRAETPRAPPRMSMSAASFLMVCFTWHAWLTIDCRFDSRFYLGYKLLLGELMCDPNWNGQPFELHQNLIITYTDKKKKERTASKFYVQSNVILV